MPRFVPLNHRSVDATLVLAGSNEFLKQDAYMVSVRDGVKLAVPEFVGRSEFEAQFKAAPTVGRKKGSKNGTAETEATTEVAADTPAPVAHNGHKPAPPLIKR